MGSLKHITQAPDGTVYFTDGINDMRKWDGTSSSIEDAGIVGPSTLVSMVASGDGDITGTVYAYQRWLDADGRVSNVSPVSAALTISISSKSLTDATNTSPINIASATHGLATGDRVKISGVVGNYGANGTWTITKVDNDNFTLDDSVGNGYYQSGGVWKQGANQIAYSSVDAPWPANVTRRQICRTKDGDANVLYIDVDTTDLVSTTFNSTNVDSDLTEGFALQDRLGNDLATARFGLPPSYKFAFAHSNDRMVGTGDPHYRVGAVSVTNGSATVTGIGTAWTDVLAGRVLYVRGANASYEISSVNTATQVITLSSNYGGTTNVFESYAIIPTTGNRKTVMWSESSLPEAWHPLHLKRLPEDVDSGEVVGCFTHERWVYIACENRIFRFSYQTDPSTAESYIGYGPQRGMVNNRTRVHVNGMVYIMDTKGIYTFAGNDMRPISEGIRSLFERGSDSPYKINWRWSQYFHATHDPNTETVKFFVSMSGRYPRHALCYQYRLKRWWIEEYPVGITSSTLGRRDNGNQVYLGCEARTIIATGLGNSDKASKTGGTLRGDVTSAGRTWIADSTASFETSELVNAPVHIVSGRGKGQWRKIVAVSATQLNVDQPWLVQPDTTSVYQAGGINWKYKTGWFRWAAGDKEMKRDIELVFDPQANTSSGTMQVYHDRSKTPIDWGYTRSSAEGNGIESTNGDPKLLLNYSKSNGILKHEMGAMRETGADGNQFVAVEVDGVTNAEQQKLFEMSVGGAQ